MSSFHLMPEVLDENVYRDKVVVPPTPAELKAAESKPFFNKVIPILGFLVFLFGLAGLTGQYLHYSPLRTIIPSGKPLALSTAYTLACLGIGIKTILSSHPYHEKPVWLWRLHYISWFVPVLVGGYWLYYYWASPGFVLLDMSTYGAGSMTFLTAFFLVLSGLALFAFLIGQRSEAVVCYVVCVFGFFIFNIGLLTALGYFYKEPFLYSLQMALPTALSAICIGFAFLIGTIHFRGLMLPLLSGFRNVKLLGWISMALGIGIALFALNSIVLSLRHSNTLYIYLTEDFRHLYTGALLTSGTFGVILSVIGLRASRYLSKAQYFAYEQLRFFRQEGLKRRILEITGSSMELDDTLQNLTSAIGKHLGVNNCIIAVYDRNNANNITHLQQCVTPPCREIQKEDIFTHSSILKNPLIRLAQPNALLILNSKADFPDFYKLYAERYGIQSSLEFDFLYHGRSYGRLMLNQCDSERNWAEEEIEFLQEITQTVTMAIRQVEIIAEEQAFHQELEKSERFRKVELSKVPYHVLMEMDDEIREKQARITINVAESLFADETQMEQLLQNLVGNALKYQPPGQEPEIHIESSCRDHIFCQFTVSDNGIGIPPQTLKRIFEPFERLHGKTSPYTGSGVGLAICKRIVERHGGPLVSRVKSVRAPVLS